MRLLLFFMFAGCMQISARGLAQTISLSEKNASLEVVLKSIKQQSGYVFFYNYRVMEKSKPVTVNLTGASLKEALDACFKGQPLTYSIEGKLVTITIRSAQPDIAPPGDAAAEIPVTGVVRDSLGNPIADVTVSVRGKKKAVRTDQYGRFSISAEPGDVIIFSSVSYNRREVVINSNTSSISIELSQRVPVSEEIEYCGSHQQY